MLTSERADLFSNWNPHFTPEWLSDRLAEHVPRNFTGSVVDPACGAGNLLAAAALRTNARSRRHVDIEFLGCDVSGRAVKACKQLLSTLLPHRNFAVKHRDFLRADPLLTTVGPTTVIMNPPFRGYGELSKQRRRQITNELHLRGRFNLGYAFVHRAVALYQPVRLVSLLPSNWIHSRGSFFRQELETLHGKWEWEDVGEDAFDGLNVHLGILVWRPKGRTRPKANKMSSEVALRQSGIDVRNGVATGCDDVFYRLANMPLPFGKRILATKGRDVGRDSSMKIWVPPSNVPNNAATLFAGLIPRAMADKLRKRTCMTDRGRRIFEYHETTPNWFQRKPKILLPEIATGRVRVEFDAKGVKLPLHSAIAIGVPSKNAGRLIARYLTSARVQKRLLRSGPKLSGGAVRLQVPAVRDVLRSYLSELRSTNRRLR